MLSLSSSKTEMLGIGSPKEIKKARKLLDRFYLNHPNVFKRLFMGGSSAVVPPIDIRLLEELGILEKDNNWCTSKYMICYIQNNFILTDPPSLRQRDRVFPIFDDESAFLANNLIVDEGEVGLDIGTGSGIYAIVAAQKAKRMIATDVNKKVENYVRFNAILNNVEEKIEFCFSDVYANLNGERFDFMISDPPFVPTPPQSHFYIHSDGGPIGLDIVHGILFDHHAHLKSKGRLQMLALSLGKNSEPVIIADLKRCLAGEKASVTVTDLYNGPLNDINSFVARFERENNYEKWRHFLYDNGFNKLYYLYIDVQYNGKSDLAFIGTEERFCQTFYSGCWEGRLNRYMMPESNVASFN